MSYIEHLLQKHPLIPAVKNLADLTRIPLDNVDLIFLLNVGISEVNSFVQWAQENDKLVFVHLDLAHGIGRDREGIKYLADVLGIDGIITTKNHLIKYAKEFALITIQRLFIVDSAAIDTGKAMIKESQPDLVEILPGIVIPQIKAALRHLGIPIIAGGLVTSIEDIQILLKNNVLAISTSDAELWKYTSK